MSHEHDIPSELTFNEKLEKLLHHWIKHNESHAETYRDWMERAGKKDRKEIAALMGDAADLTIQINNKFEQALRSMTRG